MFEIAVIHVIHLCRTSLQVEMRQLWQVKVALVQTGPAVLSLLCFKTFILPTFGETEKALSPSTRYCCLNTFFFPYRGAMFTPHSCGWQLMLYFFNNYAIVVQVTVSEEGSISGSLQRSKKTKRNWKKLWFHLKDKVLYTYRAQEVRGNMHSPLTWTAHIHT